MSDEANPARAWSGADLDLVVGDYVVMLAKTLAGQPLDTAGHQRALRFVTGRSGGAIEFRQCDISAALTLVGLPILKAFQPRWPLADDLIDAVDRQLTARPALISAALRPAALFDPAGTPLPLEGPPPVFSDDQARPGPRAAAFIARFDPAARDFADRFLTETGLAAVLALEQQRLCNHGRPDLADQVRPAGPDDPPGCAVISATPAGQPRLIAVKATTGGVATPFHLTDAEHALWRDQPDAFRLHRLHDLGREARFYTLRPPRPVDGLV